MKKLLFILLFPLGVSAQDTLRIPAPAAKAIVQELVGCDSIKAIHELTKEQLIFTEKKAEVLDSMVSKYKEKCLVFIDMIQNEKEKFHVQRQWTEDLRKENRNLKITNKIYKTGFWAGLFIGTIGYIYLTKPF